MPDTDGAVQGAFDFDAVGQLARLLLTIPEAARMLAIGRSTLYELVAAGDIEVVHVGRSARLRVDEVRNFVERLRSLSEPSGNVPPAKKHAGARRGT